MGRKIKILENYDHSVASWIIFLITAAGTFIALRVETFIGGLSNFERFIIMVLNITYIIILAYLLCKNGYAQSNLWFRKYILSAGLFTALLFYNLANIFEIIGKCRGVANTSLLLGTSLLSLMFAAPFLIILYLITIFIEARYLSKEDILKKFFKLGISAVIIGILILVVTHILS